MCPDFFFVFLSLSLVALLASSPRACPTLLALMVKVNRLRQRRCRRRRRRRHQVGRNPRTATAVTTAAVPRNRPKFSNSGTRSFSGSRSSCRSSTPVSSSCRSAKHRPYPRPRPRHAHLSSPWEWPCCNNSCRSTALLLHLLRAPQRPPIHRRLTCHLVSHICQERPQEPASRPSNPSPQMTVVQRSTQSSRKSQFPPSHMQTRKKRLARSSRKEMI